jgi:multidrug transporter EmrE-like cation transporter
MNVDFMDLLKQNVSAIVLEVIHNIYLKKIKQFNPFTNFTVYIKVKV